MTAQEVEKYGDGLSLLQKLRLLSEWAPLLARAQSIIEAKDPHERAVAIVDVLQWVAGKTAQTETDDEALEHVESILKSDEGRAAFDWLMKKVGVTR